MPFRIIARVWVLIIMQGLVTPVYADAGATPAAGVAEAWLVTIGPGELYWERFGHNAIWIREPAEDLDHTFNFGFFDFEAENFLLEFMAGRMMYFSAAQPAVREFEYYRSVNRSIRVQKLNLDTRQFRRLRDHLVHQVKPENRAYRYDYYLDNCSTRIRDALDLALGGALRDRTGVEPANLNFRGQTRRLTQMQFWYNLGLETVLGMPVDRPVSRWDEMFIPMVLADEIAGMRVPGDRDTPLVMIDESLFNIAPADVPATPASVWHRYLLAGLLVVLLGWFSGRFMPAAWLSGLCFAWLLIAASHGMVLAALWLLTDHEVARHNVNLLLLNPLVLVALAPGARKIAALLLAGGVLVSAGLLLWPHHQYNLDVLAILGPVNLGVAAYLFKKRD